MNHFYEPKRKIHNKIWVTNEIQRPCIAKRTMIVKKGHVCNSFTNQGPAIQIDVSKGKSVSIKFYKNKVLHKLEKYFKNHRPATGA
jgi:hypothetical protein